MPLCRTCTTRDKGKEGGTGFDTRTFTYTRKLSTQTKEKKKKKKRKKKLFSHPRTRHFQCSSPSSRHAVQGSAHICALALEPPALRTDGDGGCCDADEVGPVGGDI